MKCRMAPFLGNLADSLAGVFAPTARSAKSVRAAIALALDFWTWRRLAGEGMSDDDGAGLMVGTVKAAALKYRKGRYLDDFRTGGLVEDIPRRRVRTVKLRSSDRHLP